jgi:spore maturation protein CgeB
MTIAIFGLSITSCWGNGHATLWRALCRALGRRGHHVEFFERDQHFYRAHRDLDRIPGHELRLYDDWSGIAPAARDAIQNADVAVVTSYCPDARAAADLIREHAGGVRVFYDMDTPVTLDRLRAGEDVEYLPSFGLAPFDLVLSYAGGPALVALQQLGARRAVALYGCVEPDDYPPRTATPASGVSYLATYAPDRAQPFDDLLIAVARRLPDRRFVVGGPKYDSRLWPSNVDYRQHVGQGDHLAFYGAAQFTLNLTRGPMMRWGHCPSGRLFEAAASATPLLTDDWPGLDEFFAPDAEIRVVRTADDVIASLEMDSDAQAAMAGRARERVLDACTADVRAREFEEAVAAAGAGAATHTGTEG